MKGNAPAIGNKQFSWRAFATGLAVVALVYAGLFAWLNYKAVNTLERLSARLAHATVSIERAAPVSAPAPAEAYVYPPAPVQMTIQTGHESEMAGPPPPPVSTEETHSDVQISITHTGALEPAPIEGLYTQTEAGKLPVISETGLTPFQAYRRPFLSQEKPVIALAVTGYGLSEKDSELALSLPPEISLILSPYADNPEQWVTKARENGHEVWLYAPFENDDFVNNDPGPQALLTRQSLPENRGKLEWIMARVTGYAGIVGKTDRVFLSVHTMFKPLINLIFDRGLAYFELNTEGSALIEAQAINQGAAFSAAEQTARVWDEKLASSLEKAANERGSTNAVVDLNPKNVAALLEWAVTLPKQGLDLAPLSALAAQASSGKAASAETKSPEPEAVTPSDPEHPAPEHHE